MAARANCYVTTYGYRLSFIATHMALLPTINMQPCGLGPMVSPMARVHGTPCTAAPYHKHTCTCLPAASQLLLLWAIGMSVALTACAVWLAYPLSSC